MDPSRFKIAFMFPGQGSQSVGMMNEFSSEYIVKRTFMEASDALALNLWSLAEKGPIEKINRTELTQPLILAGSVAIWRLWKDRNGLTPDYMAGHSLGEYSALVAAGALELTDAIQLVSLRGELMQNAVPEGEGLMAAILGLSDEKVIAACKASEQGSVVSAVNFNAPGQVVIAGEKAAVERAIEACKDAGAKKAMPLPVSVPSHCALMKPAAEKLSEALNRIPLKEPTVPLVNNVDVAIENDVQAIRDALVRQLYSPVRWVQTIEFLADQGVERFFECGPGKVLASLIRRVNRDIDSVALQTQSGFEALIP